MTNKNKWLIALATVGIHISIGSVYAWSVLVKPIMEECGFNLSAVTFVFSLAIFFLGLSASILGKYVDKYGPRLTGLVATACFNFGLVGTAIAVSTHSIMMLYISYGVILGVGLGLGYVTPVSTLVKAFPKYPGIASGVAIMGFGFGAVIASPVMQFLISELGLVPNFLILAMSYTAIMVPSSLYLGGRAEKSPITKQQDEYLIPGEVYRTKQFKVLWWLFYVNIACGIGLLAVISPMIQEFYDFSPERAAAFVGLVGLVNGIGRLYWASLSDIITRKWTYIAFFIIQAVLFFSIGHVANEYLFELFVLVIISCYGGGFSCMPAYLNDLFGKRYLSTIHGKMLLAWGMAGIIGPLWMAHCKEATGSYVTVLHLFGGLLVLNIFMAWWLKEHQEVHKADTPAEA